MKKAKLLKVRCPVCQEFALWEGNPFRPFCGEGCKTKDLGNWATGRYRIAGDPVGPEDLDAAGGKKTSSEDSE